MLAMYLGSILVRFGHLSTMPDNSPSVEKPCCYTKPLLKKSSTSTSMYSKSSVNTTRPTLCGRNSRGTIDTPTQVYTRVGEDAELITRILTRIVRA